MKRTLTVLALAGCFFGPTAAVAQESDIEAFARAFMAAEELAWEQGEFDDLEALEHPDVVFQNINGTVISGWDAHKQAIIDTLAGFDGGEVQQEWTYLMGEGSMFTVSYVWTFSVQDQPTQMHGIVVGRVSDGKLLEEWGAGYATPAPAN